MMNVALSSFTAVILFKTSCYATLTSAWICTPMSCCQAARTISFKVVASPERKFAVLLLMPDVPLDFCTHDEGTDDVGPIRDEDQGGCST